MSCELTQRFVPGYLDGELDLVRTIEMETHLKSCALVPGNWRTSRRCVRPCGAVRCVCGAGSTTGADPSSLGASTPQKTLNARAHGTRSEIAVGGRVRRALICTVTAWQLVPGLMDLRMINDSRRRFSPATCGRSKRTTLWTWLHGSHTVKPGSTAS